MNDFECKERISQLMSEKAKMAGQMNAISMYLDDVGVPKLDRLHKRVKLLAILYKEQRLENERLTLLAEEQ